MPIRRDKIMQIILRQGSTVCSPDEESEAELHAEYHWHVL